MDKLIPLPAHLDGARLVEVTYTLGVDEPALVSDWPLVGWDADRWLPVVVKPGGGLSVRQVSEHPQQTTGGSNTFFATRIAPSPLEVRSVGRELTAMMESAFNPPPADQTVIDVELPS